MKKNGGKKMKIIGRKIFIQRTVLKEIFYYVQISVRTRPLSLYLGLVLFFFLHKPLPQWFRVLKTSFKNKKKSSNKKIVLESQGKKTFPKRSIGLSGDGVIK